jgi:hypothetical protein
MTIGPVGYSANFEIPAVAYSADLSKYVNSFEKTKEKKKSFLPRNLGLI